MTLISCNNETETLTHREKNEGGEAEMINDMLHALYGFYFAHAYSTPNNWVVLDKSMMMKRQYNKSWTAATQITEK